jgi:hypothetical protein
MHFRMLIVWGVVMCALVGATSIKGQQAQQRNQVGNRSNAAVRRAAAEPASPAVAAPAQANSQTIVPRLIKFNSTLRDLAGKPLAGPVDVTFALYTDEAGGSPLWFET